MKAAFLFIAAAVIAPVLLSSCATTAGFGQDMQKLGDKIEDSAHRNAE